MQIKIKNYLLLALMLSSAALAVAIRPTEKIADLGAPVQLEKIIPSTFGDWREVRMSGQTIVNPQELEMLNAIYSQTLSRTYVNSAGYRIMLSIAYGGDQSRDLQVHRPEVCYAAQGFQTGDQRKVNLSLGDKEIPVMRLTAKLGERNEPITYWVRIGDKIVRGNLEQGFARLGYGIQGQIADGLLFRVSSIDKDATMAFQNQDSFIGALSASIPPQEKSPIFGAGNPIQH